MLENERLLGMLRALSDVKEEGGVFTAPDTALLTLHAGHDGVPLTKGQRYVLDASDVYALAQESSPTDRGGRKAGFF
jgi:hypothetical protein